MNCAECGNPAAVLHGDEPLCGACFYKRSVVTAEPVVSSAANDAMFRRLAEAITMLESLASRIAVEMNELVKSRDSKAPEK